MKWACNFLQTRTHTSFFLAALHLPIWCNIFWFKFCACMCKKRPSQISHWRQITWIITLLSTSVEHFADRHAYTYQMVYICPLYMDSNSDNCIMSLFLILRCGLCLVQDDSEFNFKFDGPSSRNSIPPVKQDRKDKEKERLVRTLVCWL